MCRRANRRRRSDGIAAGFDHLDHHRVKARKCKMTSVRSQIHPVLPAMTEQMYLPDNRQRTVRSKLKGPVFVASELSGCLLITRRRRGCGEVGIPRFGRDFQARWESLLCDFSTARLLHSLLPIATDPRQTLGVVAPHAMRP